MKANIDLFHVTNVSARLESSGCLAQELRVTGNTADAVCYYEAGMVISPHLYRINIHYNTL